MIVSALILLCVVFLSLMRPKIGPILITHAMASLIGAFLMIVAGVINADTLHVAEKTLIAPVITITAMMVNTVIVEKSGLFERIIKILLKDAKHSLKRLMTAIFFTGCGIGTLITNDTAVLIFTPLVYHMVQHLRTHDGKMFSLDQKMPFYFAVLAMANITGAFAISNPINTVVAQRFSETFISYAAWMVLPALGSTLSTYALIRFWFKDHLQSSFKIINTKEIKPMNTFQKLSLIVLIVTMLGLLFGGVIHMAIWSVVLMGALAQMGLYVYFHEEKENIDDVKDVFREVEWGLVVFVVSMFFVAAGLRNSGWTDLLSSSIANVQQSSATMASILVGYISAFLSALMNNHPTADFMSWMIKDMDLPPLQERLYEFSALIGGDMGPKMLPLGSLAAIIWFSVLRSHKEEMSVIQYIRIGIPMALVGIASGLLILNIEYQIAVHFS